jgi:hypothetical protein
MAQLLEGWEAIAKFFKMSERGFCSERRKKELIDGGFVFYRWTRAGTGKVKMACAFDTELIRYSMIKASKGETI